MATGVVDIKSELVRKQWMVEGLVQRKAMSFWAPFTGTSPDSVVYQANSTNAKDGHTIVFDYDGNTAGEAFVDKEQAFGKGEQKKKFSSKLISRRIRYAVDNGDKFDAVNIGDLNIAQHADSRTKLADQFIRGKDQMLFDSMQGMKDSVGQSHIIRAGNKSSIGALTSTDVLTYDFLWDLEAMVKTSSGFTVGGARRPLEPYVLQNGEPVWLFVIDPVMKRQLVQDVNFRAVMPVGDLRGADNMAISGVIGRIGSLIIKEAPMFFGATSSRIIGKSKVEISGLRQLDETGLYTGETGFGASTKKVASLGLLLGKSAAQIGMGMMPDYKFQESSDFGIKSESALEVWMNTQKTQLIAENEDYVSAKVAGMDYGVVGVQTYSHTVA
jgi:hypothetical protein